MVKKVFVGCNIVCVVGADHVLYDVSDERHLWYDHVEKKTKKIKKTKKQKERKVTGLPRASERRHAAPRRRRMREAATRAPS